MHDLALILSAKSINQMLVRVSYLHRFAEKRRTKLSDILSAGDELRARRAELEDVLARNEHLLSEAENEQRNLAQLHRNRQRVVTELRQQRSTIERSIEQSQVAASELESRIRELTAASSTRRRVAEAANPRAAAEFTEMTGSFLQNRGNLPWPTSGVVSEPFGDVINPVYGTRTPNPGLIIETPSSAEVRSIFDGQVIDLSILPEYGTYVVVEHGEYKTVYSNFSMTYIAEGDRVEAGQIIGRAGTEAEPKGTAVFFALFKEGVPIDPLPWLIPR
jgi:septal ring factor EnvC (AmiA/AmiB activator)